MADSLEQRFIRFQSVVLDRLNAQSTLLKRLMGELKAAGDLKMMRKKMESLETEMQNLQTQFDSKYEGENESKE